MFGTRYEYQPQITGVDDVEATATRARSLISKSVATMREGGFRESPDAETRTVAPNSRGNHRVVLRASAERREIVTAIARGAYGVNLKEARAAVLSAMLAPGRVRCVRLFAIWDAESTTRPRMIRASREFALHVVDKGLLLEATTVLEVISLCIPAEMTTALWDYYCLPYA